MQTYQVPFTCGIYVRETPQYTEPTYEFLLDRLSEVHLPRTIRKRNRSWRRDPGSRAIAPIRLCYD
jgi:hypothetical protein